MASFGAIRVTTIDELVLLPSEEDAVAITFDDGFSNFLEVAAPRLLSERLPVTIFVVSDRVGGTNAWGGRPGAPIPRLPLLDWHALAALSEQGVALGAHSRTHLDLTSIGAGEVACEVNGSADAIERETGQRPTVFAYPYGRLNRYVSTVVAERFQYACTTEFLTISGEVVPAELPRLDMYYFQKSWQLQHWGSPLFAAAIRLRHRARQLRQRLVVPHDQDARS